MSDIDVGAISEALNDKLDRDGMNAGNPCAVVVETSSSSILPSWWRVYSDGWVEQGGVTTVSSSNSTQNISLLKTMQDANYFVTFTRTTGSTGSTNAAYVEDFAVYNTTSASTIVLARGYNSLYVGTLVDMV